MLRIFSGASGEEVVALEESELSSTEHGSTVGSLKRYLANVHFEQKYFRFQLRILHEAHACELKEDERIIAPMDLQLMLMNHLPADKQRDREFLMSCEEGDMEEVERNLQALQDPNFDVDDVGEDVHVGVRNPLLAAAAEGHAGVVRLLLEAGANIEWQSDDEDMTALSYAVCEGHPQVVRILLDSAADPNHATPLHIALESERSECVRLLLESRASTDTKNNLGHGPLHLAVEEGGAEDVRLLLSFRADTEVQSQHRDHENWTPLHFVARHNHPIALDQARLLLDSKADMEALTNGTAFRPLHLAAQTGSLEVVRLLVDSGAEKAAVDHLGRTPWKLAIIAHRQAVAELLVHHVPRKRPRADSEPNTMPAAKKWLYWGSPACGLVT